MCNVVLCVLNKSCECCFRPSHSTRGRERVLQINQAPTRLVEAWAARRLERDCRRVRASRLSGSPNCSWSDYCFLLVRCSACSSTLLVARMSTTTTTTVAQSAPITAENILRLFPQINTSLANAASATQDNDLEGYDEEQIRLMDEVCIVLDENDLPIGSASKKVCMYNSVLPFCT